MMVQKSHPGYSHGFNITMENIALSIKQINKYVIYQKKWCYRLNAGLNSTVRVWGSRRKHIPSFSTDNVYRVGGIMHYPILSTLLLGTEVSATNRLERSVLNHFQGTMVYTHIIQIRDKACHGKPVMGDLLSHKSSSYISHGTWNRILFCFKGLWLTLTSFEWLVPECITRQYWQVIHFQWNLHTRYAKEQKL